MRIEKQIFGRLPSGEAVTRYTLQNRNGMLLSVLDLGAAVQRLLVPDKTGRPGDVVCGFDSAADYLGSYQGVIVGRYANRIANARFVLDGVEHRLTPNAAPHHLHGGQSPFQWRMWQVSALCEGEEPSLSLSICSPHGDEGYPGTLTLTVTYTLKLPCTLSIRFHAETDRKTVLNPISHMFFNLGNFQKKDVRSHTLWIDADAYLEAQRCIPTGRICPVEGTPFDFRVPKAFGRDMENAALHETKGYDVCLVFCKREERALLHRLTLSCAESGREMRLLTTLPAMQLYGGNYLNAAQAPFKGGIPQYPYAGICPEVSQMPDSPNHASFTDTTLSPNERYEQTTEYVFSTFN